jgi:hypothetical protein
MSLGHKLGCQYLLFFRFFLVGDKNSVCRGPCASRGILMSISATVSGKGGGGGILEKPVIERTTPGRESEFDLRYVPAAPPPPPSSFMRSILNKYEERVV